jgi:hypothetical protein
MRVALVCLGAVVLTASLALPASPQTAHRGLSAKKAQATAVAQVETTGAPTIVAPPVPASIAETPLVRTEQRRIDTPEFLIYERAQVRARERINRIEARQRLGISLLRPRPVRFWHYDPFTPWIANPRLVYALPY